MLLEVHIHTLKELHCKYLNQSVIKVANITLEGEYYQGKTGRAKHKTSKWIITLKGCQT